MKRILMIVCMLTGMLLIGVYRSHASDNQYDATDRDVFGEQALIINSDADQSKQLEYCVQKAATDKKTLYIPAGQYYVDHSVSFNHSDIHVKGDDTNATVLLNRNHMSKDDNDKVLLDASAYNHKENMNIEYLYLDGIEIRLRNTSHAQIENNVFYDPGTKFVVYIEDGKEFHIQHNIFLRDLDHTVANSDRSRTIYVGGYYYSDSSFKWTENVYIKDNLIGAKIDELDALKSLQKENQQNIIRLQNALQNNEITLSNDQNYITTGVNSFGMLKTAYIENNVFYSFWDDDMLKGDAPIINDHVTYLRGSQNVYISGNHVRGFHNGPAGGFKFKSGRNVVIANNYLRNTGIILSNHPEYGYGETFGDGEISEFTNLLIANNTFDFKKWQEFYGIGINYEVDNSAGLPTKIENNVFMNNQYINYHNIPQNRRFGFGLPNSFAPQNTYIKENTRDDTEDRVLTIQDIDTKYGGQFDDLMAKDWIGLLQSHPDLEMYYRKQSDQPIPFLNKLPKAVATTIELGESVSAESLITNAYDDDNQKPIFTIMNPDELQIVGEQSIRVRIAYPDQIPEVMIQVPLIVTDTTKPQMTIKQTEWERGSRITLDDIVTATDLSGEVELSCAPAIDSMKLGNQAITITAVDASGNRVEQTINLVIKKSALEQEIDALFDENGKLKESITDETIARLEKQIEQLSNQMLIKELHDALDNAKEQMGYHDGIIPEDSPLTGDVTHGSGYMIGLLATAVVLVTMRKSIKRI